MRSHPSKMSFWAERSGPWKSIGNQIRWMNFAVHTLALYYRPEWTLLQRVNTFGMHLLSGDSEDEGPDPDPDC